MARTETIIYEKKIPENQVDCLQIFFFPLSVPPDPISQAHQIEHQLQLSLTASHSPCGPQDHSTFLTTLSSHLLLCTRPQFQQTLCAKPGEAPLRAGNKLKTEPHLSYGSWNPVHPVSSPAL